MGFISQYVAKKPDAKGVIQYEPGEHAVWQQLYERQMTILPNHACNEHIDGLQVLGLRTNEIPQIPDLNKILAERTGFQLQAVEALISAKAFFELLAARKFPVATFIRSQEELDYVQEPDIFHELFGHCPLLTVPVYADFIQQFGQFVLKQPESEWPLLQRFFWFTVEFGLINTDKGIRAYGGGILSSYKETVYSTDSDEPIRANYHPVTIFRTPYRIDKLQPIYFMIDNYESLYASIQDNLMSKIQRARELGEFPALFKVDSKSDSIHILAC